MSLRQNAGIMPGANEMHPLLLQKLHKPRTVFAPGGRIRMNILPMFLNVFIPWGVFVLCSGFTSFHMMYANPILVWTIIVIVWLLAISMVGTAVWVRRNDPAPSWMTYLAIMVALAALTGTAFGTSNYEAQLREYYQVSDLKEIKGIDPSKEKGQNVMDAGIFYFTEGAHLSSEKAWHFKHKSLYCVAPIMGLTDPSETQTYDFWAVGTDCCAEGASDFRCGDYNKNGARSAIRLIGDSAAPYYRLAVQQAEALHGITSPHPIFFTWHLDPQEEVSGWLKRGYYDFLFASFFAFVFSLFCLVLAVIRFSWIGRSDNRMDLNFTDDPNWKLGNQAKPLDMRTHEYTVA